MDLQNVNSAPQANLVFNNYFANVTGTLEFNGSIFDAQSVAFHSPAENIINGTVADLEMQIYLNNPNSTNIAAVLSFLFTSTNSSLNNNVNNTDFLGMNLTLSQPQNQYFGSLSNTSWQINLAQLSNMINNKYVNDTFLNMLTYTSTVNFESSTSTCQPVQWFVYGGGLYINNTILQQFANLIINNASNINITVNTNTSVLNANLSQASYAGNNFQNAANLVSSTRMCFSGYFLVTMNSNYGLWFAWGLTVIFFLFTLIMDEKPMNNIDYVENTWTHHPIYSIATVGNDIFTRKSRCASVLVQIINQFVWNGVFYAASYQPGSVPTAGQLIINPAIAMAIGWGVLYFIGLFLRTYYLKKSQFMESEASNREELNDSAQFYIYIYYFFVFVLVSVGFSFTISSLDQVQSYNNPATANFWVGSVFIGLAYDWLILDPIVCILGSSASAVKSLLKWKGYFYDDVCHKTYLNALKRE